eukprot:1409612-Prymnesium_polylepis.1
MTEVLTELFSVHGCAGEAAKEAVEARLCLLAVAEGSKALLHAVEQRVARRHGKQLPTRAGWPIPESDGNRRS